MIMQPNVKIYHKNSYNSSWGDGQSITLYPAGNIPTDAVFCFVPEYDGIRIVFESGNEEDKLIIDHFTEDAERIIQPGEEIIVVSPDPQNASYMPSPAHYSVRVLGHGGQWESLYIINSRHGWEYIHGMRAYLEDKVSGITYDLIRRRSGMWSPETGPGLPWFNMLRNILEKVGNIRRQTELILLEPLEDIEKIYQIQQTSKKPDRKSQRWLQGKGLAKNANPYQPSVYYEKRSVLTLDTPENQWVLWFLRFLQSHLNDISIRFDQWHQAKSSEKQLLEVQLSERSQELGAYNSMWFQSAFKKRNSNLQSQIAEIANQVQRVSTEVTKFDSNKDDLHRLMGWLSHTIHSTWLSNVSEIQNNGILSLRVRKDPRYSALYRIYMQLRENIKRDKSTKKNAYPYLGTSKLMEIYTACLVAEILQEQGWMWTTGWVAGFEGDIPTFSELKSGDILRFVMPGKYLIDLVYDKKIPRFASENHIGFEAATQHDRPDLQITLCDIDGNFIKAMIVEVKHRNHSYLVHPNAKEESTDVNEQLKAYTNLVYHTPQNTVDRNAVDRVICLYPKQDRGKPYEERYKKMIRLIQIKPVSKGEGKAFGHDLLEDQLVDFIRMYAPGIDVQ